MNARKWKTMCARKKNWAAAKWKFPLINKIMWRLGSKNWYTHIISINIERASGYRYTHTAFWAWIKSMTRIQIWMQTPERKQKRMWILTEAKIVYWIVNYKYLCSMMFTLHFTLVNTLRMRCTVLFMSIEHSNHFTRGLRSLYANKGPI